MKPLPYDEVNVAWTLDCEVQVSDILLPVNLRHYYSGLRKLKRALGEYKVEPNALMGTEEEDAGVFDRAAEAIFRYRDLLSKVAGVKEPDPPWYWGSCFIKEGTKVSHVNIVLAAVPTQLELPCPKPGSRLMSSYRAEGGWIGNNGTPMVCRERILTSSHDLGAQICESVANTRSKQC